MATSTSPVRPTTCTDTLLPCAAQVWTAVCAIATAMGSVRSLWAASWAFAGAAAPQASASASAAARRVVPIMTKSSLRNTKMVVKLRLLEVRRNLVDARLGAGFVLFAAWRTGNPDGADRIVTDLDRQRALGGD